MIILKILGIAAIVVAALFVLTFVVYFFNLDMKLTAALEPIFDGCHRQPGIGAVYLNLRQVRTAQQKPVFGKTAHGYGCGPQSGERTAAQLIGHIRAQDHIPLPCVRPEARQGQGPKGEILQQGGPAVYDFVVELHITGAGPA